MCPPRSGLNGGCNTEANGDIGDPSATHRAMNTAIAMVLRPVRCRCSSGNPSSSASLQPLHDLIARAWNAPGMTTKIGVSLRYYSGSD